MIHVLSKMSFRGHFTIIILCTLFIFCLFPFYRLSISANKQLVIIFFVSFSPFNQLLKNLAILARLNESSGSADVVTLASTSASASASASGRMFWLNSFHDPYLLNPLTL